MGQTTVFHHVRVFDGERVLFADTVIVEEDTIAAVGSDLAFPPGSTVIDGRGQTLLPGLIDGHTHTFGPSGLQQALILGVTTELDMFTDWRLAQQLKTLQAAGEGRDKADLRSSGTLATAPGGHGTQFGLTIPTLTEPAKAQDFVDERIAEGSDYIKIIYDDGKSVGRSFNTLSKATMAALVRAAHKRGKLAIVHITAYQSACDAIELGADALAHLFVDTMPDQAFGDFVAEHHAFVVPTLAVLEGVTGKPGGASLVTNAWLAPYLTGEAVRQLQSTFPPRGSDAHPDYTVAEATLRHLKAANVPILAGTDAPMPGTAHGVSLHRELELLVKAGLTAGEALAAATSVPAHLFGLKDRGRLVEGAPCAGTYLG